MTGNLYVTLSFWSRFSLFVAVFAACSLYLVDFALQWLNNLPEILVEKEEAHQILTARMK